MPEQIQTITTLDELERAIAVSSVRPAVIFKHSASCGLSAQAFDSIRDWLDQGLCEAAWFVLPVRASRAVSTAVATRFGIRHESPQALVLFEGKVVWHGSHFRATSQSIVAALDRLVVGSPSPTSALE